jgi:RNA polymerase sigma factor (sigma-70 family)
MEDDKSLVRAILTGSNPAFEQLIVRYQRLCWTIIGRLVDEREDVRDLCQECFLQVYRYLHTFRFDASLKTWIAQIAYTVACQHLRRQRSPQTADPVVCERDACDLPCETDLERAAIFEQNAAQIQRAMTMLGPTERAIVQMFYFEEFTIAEVAIATGLPDGTIKSHLSRARAKLRERLLTAA